MHEHSESDHTLANRAYRIIASFYLLPIVLYSGYALWAMPSVTAWGVVVFGLLFSIFGACLLILAIRTWEYSLRATVQLLVRKRITEQQQAVSEIRDPVVEAACEQDHDQDDASTPTPTSTSALEGFKHKLLQAEERNIDLAAKLDKRKEEVDQLEVELRKFKQQTESFSAQIQSSQENTSHKDGLLRDFQKTVGEQRSIIDNKQQYILKLETRVQDLTYEVKTLLQLGDMDVGAADTSEQQACATATHPVVDVFQVKSGAAQNSDIEEMVHALPISSDKKVHTHYDAAVQLQKCIEVAKKLTGASHLAGSSSRFLDMSVDSYAIDLRRLFDSFRNENACMILLYNRKENKMLFVNNQVKGLLGWSPERFVKDFPQLIQKSVPEWRHGIAQLQQKSESQIRLLVKTRSNEEKPVHCHLGMVPSGAVVDHVVGICYPA